MQKLIEDIQKHGGTVEFRMSNSLPAHGRIIINLWGQYKAFNYVLGDKDLVDKIRKEWHDLNE